jgi:flavin reductase (DIM6/NTAB) family NADH-FMN oxidoreductase RutF
MSPPAVDRELYRAVAGAFPTGIAVVTAVDPDGEPRGLTTQSFVGLSTEPPLVLVSVDRTSRTLPALQHSRCFVINFLRAGAEEVSIMFASKRDDKFAGLTWTPSPLANGAPILDECVVAVAECVVETVHEAGDHVVFIGRVVGGKLADGVPLMYYRRAYAPWPAPADRPT